jgi:hypothetical protein
LIGSSQESSNGGLLDHSAALNSMASSPAPEAGIGTLDHSATGGESPHFSLVDDGYDTYANGGTGLAGGDLYHGLNDVVNADALFAQAGQLLEPVSLDPIDTQWAGTADLGSGWTSSTLEVDLSSAPSDPSMEGGWTVYVDQQPYVPSAQEQQLGIIQLDGPAQVSIVLYDTSGEPQSMTADHVDTITWGAGGHTG